MSATDNPSWKAKNAKDDQPERDEPELARREHARERDERDHLQQPDWDPAQADYRDAASGPLPDLGPRQRLFVRTLRTP